MEGPLLSPVMTISDMLKTVLATPGYVAALCTIAGALLGTFVTALLTVRRERKSARRALTLEFAKEYLSQNFLLNRVAAGKMSALLELERISIKDVASGYWFPGRAASFDGPIDTGGQTLHERVTMYLDFYKRLGYCIQKKLVDDTDLSLLTEMSYGAYLVQAITDEAESQAREDKKTPPRWASYVRTTLRTVPLGDGALDKYPTIWLPHRGSSAGKSTAALKVHRAAKTAGGVPPARVAGTRKNVRPPL